MSVRLNFICTLVAVVGMGSAFASESGWYVGLNAGSVSSKFDQSQLELVRTNWISGNGSHLVRSPETTNVDDSDSSWSLLGGYSSSRYASVEAAYVDLGTIRYHYSGQFAFGSSGYTKSVTPPVVYPGQSEIAWDQSAVTLKIIGRIPFADRFDVHAQLGLAYMMTKVSWATSMYSDPSQEFLLESNIQRISPVYGLGAAYNFSNRLTLNLDWQRYAISEDQDEALDLSMDSDAITLAVLFRFGASH